MPDAITCHPTEVRIPPLPPAEAGTRISDLGGMQCWVDLCCVKADQPGIEPRATCQSQVQLPTAEPPRNSLPPWRPAVTLTFNLWPPVSNQVIIRVYWILPVSFIEIAHAVREIGLSWQQDLSRRKDERTRRSDSPKTYRLRLHCLVAKTYKR